jgi:hypothetical protein
MSQICGIFFCFGTVFARHGSENNSTKRNINHG